ncbi:hypothetical protein DPMN_049514 [Dreissena polymorpha]|uniref:Uncharacterized protein n=1 Tax=Dreissena polymorpha TaxID=45954 RepID=A0A9D4CFZ3_DREPO|nr:hypothetical protein DPMN_049474 [Dreissena polymorpha]KAH3723720.1 hypothetical protein DPMN_049514 [Dreissena polymorpha]
MDSEAYREPYRGETITIYRPPEYRDTLRFYEIILYRPFQDDILGFKNLTGCSPDDV